MNQIRKRQSDNADSGPHEEKEAVDVIYDTFDMPIPQAAPEQQRKMTDLIVVNPKRKRYGDSCGINT